MELSFEVQSKIKKLEEIRQDRGASPAEEETAKKKIAMLLAKVKESNNTGVNIEVFFPTFQANPPRMSWHVEKDGVIIAKGNGVAKFSDLYYFNEKDAKEELKQYADDKESYRYKQAESRLKLYKQFMTFINKIDTAAGSMLAKDGKGFVYENIVQTKYRTENKAVECAGSFKDGQCFIVKRSLTGGVYSGYVYRIHEENLNGKTYFTAYRLDKKLKKELTGRANPGNNFGYMSGTYLDRIKGFFEKGILAYCEIQEVKTPYEVTKCVKKAI